MLKSDTFGLLIAFLLPGSICLSGLALTWPDFGEWLISFSKSTSPTVGGFLFATLASLALGLLISAIRWALLDKPLGWWSVTSPDIDYSQLSNPDKLAAFQAVVEAHYRFYQYYGNALISILVTTPIYYIYSESEISKIAWFIIVIICSFLLLGARDCLVKYFEKTSLVLKD